jgi:hypothetical protein
MPHELPLRDARLAHSADESLAVRARLAPGDGE